MKGTMQKVFGRLARPSTTAPISKPPKATTPQPQKLAPFIQDAPKPVNSVDQMVSQYGNLDEKFGIPRKTTKRPDSPSTTLQVKNQADGRSTKLVPVTQTKLHQASTYPSTSSNSQVGPAHGSIRSISNEPSTPNHATQVIAEIVEASVASNARPPRDPPITSHDAIDVPVNTDDPLAPSSTTPRPRRIPRRLKTRRIPFANLNKPLPELPVNDSPVDADEICPYIVHEDEPSMCSNHGPRPSVRVIATDAKQGKVESIASSEAIIASGEIGSIKEDLGRPSRAGSADRSHDSTASALTNINLENSPHGSTQEIEEALQGSTLKGKGRANPIADESRGSTISLLLGMGKLDNSSNNATCGICREEFRKVYNPIEASLKASGSSNPTLYGLLLNCPGRHEYCLSCMTSWLRTKLEGNDGAPVFPIRCPECPRTEPWEMDDETAAMVLEKDLLEAWFFKRLIASVPIVRILSYASNGPI
ncbi:hypothetical protein FRB94_014243 [Tulasnella sp. JGI-2019a]|nr:hypothetical protein FRB93_005408 [Tulasnella sp. JGI-2019a]KAG9014150.1 hypothetical protein FRB94_014243 [Tulasnella sp. JGI-2019a]